MPANKEDRAPIALNVGFGLLKGYRRLPYTLQSMLGELVDNAYQAFLDNKKALRKNGVDKCKVDITYDKSRDVLIVKDNSSGISYEEMCSAMDVGNGRERSEDSLGEVKVGLKAAAIWVCDYWTIKTKHLDEEKELELVVDNNKVINNQDGSLLQDWNEVAQSGKSGTRIEFDQLRYKFRDGQITTAIGYLASMYRNVLGKSLEISIFSRDRDTEGRPVIWEDLVPHQEGNKKFIYQFDEMTSEDEPRRVWGHIGILQSGEGKTSRGASGPNAGLSIFRRNRGLPGQITPQAWKGSHVIYGGQSNLQAQRIFGEIHFNDARVSHMKDRIVDDDLMLIEIMLKKLDAQHKIVEKALSIRSTAKEPKKSAKEGIKKVLSILNASDLNTLLKKEIPPLDLIQENNEDTWKDLNLSQDDKLEFSVRAFLFDIWIKDLGGDSPFIVYRKVDERKMEAVINQEHDFLTEHDFIKTDSYVYFLIVLLATRFKIENDDKNSMDEFFEVLDMIMRLKIELS